jgi:hypothetical protein
MRTPTLTIDYTSKDYEAFRTEMINGLQTRIPEYTDTSQSDAGIAIIEALAERLDVLSYYQDSMANECFITTCQLRSSAEVWCEILGYSPYSATASTVMQCFTLYSASETDTTIPAGTIVKTLDGTIFETTEDLVIPAGELGDEIRDEYSGGSIANDGGISKYKYLVPVKQGYTVSLVYVGISAGYPNAKYMLKHKDIITDSIVLSVYNGSEYEKWTKVDSFIDSLPDSLHFRATVGEVGTTFVVFGDGNTGAIPPASSNPIYATYRIGGGLIGNVSANTITICTDASLQTVVKTTFNPSSPIVYGKNAESLSSIKLNAPIYSSVRWGIVTLQDFESFITLNYSDKILSSCAVYDVENDIANVYVVVNPYYDFDATREEVLPVLYEHLILKGECDILEPLTEALTIEVSATISDTYSQATIQNQINYYIYTYFTVGNRKLGEEVILSDLSAEMKSSIEGVKSIKFISPVEDIITPAENAVVTADTITINMYGGDA